MKLYLIIFLNKVCEMTNGRPVFEGKSDLDQLQKIKSSMGPIAEYQLDELLKSSKQPNLKVFFVLKMEFINRMKFFIFLFY